MTELSNRDVKRFLSKDENLEQYPAKSLKTRDVSMDAGMGYFIDIVDMTFSYTDADARDSDLYLLELYLD